jgi:hypothetical protein
VKLCVSSLLCDLAIATGNEALVITRVDVDRSGTDGEEQ